MDTTTGRFTSMDSYLGSVDDLVSLHKYLYANSNPVNYIDPSGYNSYGEMNLALKIQLILTDITILKINMYCWYIRLGEASIGGKILKEVIDESFELLIEGDVDIYSIICTGVEVVYGLAGSEQEFSALRKGNKRATISQTGARELSVNEYLKQVSQAEDMYTKFRNSTTNIKIISNNTGIFEWRIKRIKEHIFYNDHIKDFEVGRFDADYDMAQAWKRLINGDYVNSDLDLLNHEIFEAKFESIFKTNYRTAHDKTVKSGRNWILEGE